MKKFAFLILCVFGFALTANAEVLVYKHLHKCLMMGGGYTIKTTVKGYLVVDQDQGTASYIGRFILRNKNLYFIQTASPWRTEQVVAKYRPFKPTDLTHTVAEYEYERFQFFLLYDFARGTDANLFITSTATEPIRFPRVFNGKPRALLTDLYGTRFSLDGSTRLVWLAALTKAANENPAANSTDYVQDLETAWQLEGYEKVETISQLTDLFPPLP